MVDAPRPVPPPDGDPQRGPQRGPQFARTDAELGGAPGTPRGAGEPARADGPVSPNVGPVRRVVTEARRLIGNDVRTLGYLHDQALSHGPHSYAVTYSWEQRWSQPERDGVPQIPGDVRAATIVGSVGAREEDVRVANPGTIVSVEADKKPSEGRVRNTDHRVRGVSIGRGQMDLDGSIKAPDGDIDTDDTDTDSGNFKKPAHRGYTTEPLIGYRNPVAAFRAGAVRGGIYITPPLLAFSQALGIGPFAETQENSTPPAAPETVVSAPLVPGESVSADTGPLARIPDGSGENAVFVAPAAQAPAPQEHTDQGFQPGN